MNVHENFMKFTDTLSIPVLGVDGVGVLIIVYVVFLAIPLFVAAATGQYDRVPLLAGTTILRMAVSLLPWAGVFIAVYIWLLDMKSLIMGKES